MSDPLALTPEAMRALGYQAVDLLVDRLADPTIPVLWRATRAEMAARLEGPPPAAAQPFDAVLARLSEDVLPFMNRADHPRFFAFIPSCQTFPATILGLPLFDDLTAEQASRVAAHAHELTAEPGEAVVERDQLERDFYVIVTGAAEVRIGGDHVRDLGAGDFFGELAALDWGAGYGYARSATVTASEPLRLLVLPPRALGDLMRTTPTLARRVQAAARERLRRT